MAFDIDGARKAGYTDDEIADHLAQAANFDASAARKSGYSSADIIGHLASARAPKPAPDAAAYSKARARSDGLEKRYGFTDAVISSLGVGDELAGGMDALGQGVTNLARRAQGKPVEIPVAAAYQAGSDAEKAAAKQYGADHPVKNALAGVGGMALFGPGKAVPVLKGIAGAAGIGGALGFASGDGGLEQRAKSSALGAGVGAGVGAAIPAIGGAAKILPRVGSALSEGGERIAQMFGREGGEPSASQVVSAKDKAAAYVADLANSAGATPNILRSNPAVVSGKPITGAEAIGRPGVSQLAAVSRRAGATPDAAESLLRQRAQAMPERIVGDLHAITGVSPEAVSGDFAAQSERLRKAASPLYDAAYATGPISTPVLKSLVGRPSMKVALNAAAKIAAEEGRNPAELGIAVTTERVPGGGTKDVATLTKEPTAQTWDYIKRGLDDVVETYRNPTTGKLNLDESGRAVLGTLNSLRTELTTANPAYAKALDAGGEPLRLEEAYRLAPKLLGSNASERVFAQRYGAMSPSQQEAFKGGFLNSVYESARNGKLRLKDMTTPAFQAKAQAVLGKDAAAKFLDLTKQEVSLAQTGSRMSPGTGSPTMELGAADADREATLNALSGVAKKISQGKPISAALQAVGSPIAGLYRGSQVPLDKATRDEVGRILLEHPNVLADILESRGVKAPKSARRLNALAPASGGYAAARVTQRNGH